MRGTDVGQRNDVLSEWGVTEIMEVGEEGEETEETETEEEAVDTKKAAKKSSRVSIQRYKGLGEMNADQLFDTTMNPENRTLLKVTLEDAERADATFTTLMGSEVAPRRKFIQTHAKNVKDLDI